eukprot:scaffold119962_cov81-Attheya_sp.AAC.4
MKAVWGDYDQLTEGSQENSYPGDGGEKDVSRERRSWSGDRSATKRNLKVGSWGVQGHILRQDLGCIIAYVEDQARPEDNGLHWREYLAQ